MKRNSLTSQILSLAVSLLIIAAGIFGFYALVHKPEAEASNKTPPAVPLVHTEAILPHEGSLDIAVDGLVVPFREIEVAAEVAGKVVFKDEACDSGRFVTRGTRLITIDPRDYEIAARRLENQLEQAVASIEELQVEIGNTDKLIELAEDQLTLEQNEVDRLAGLIQDRIVTDSDLDRAKQTVLSARNGLVQLTNQLHLLKTRQRRLESARDLVVTDLEKAKLDLERTEIEAAVDGVVIEDMVERDSFVQKGELLFKLEDTAAVEVNCRLKMEDLYWIWRQAGEEFKGTGADGYQIPRTPVTIQYRLADRQGLHYEWLGELVRYTRFDGVGLDEATRTASCRILVENPREVKIVSRLEKTKGQVPSGAPPALVRGMFVTVKFHVEPPTQLHLIPERAVQPGKSVWLVNDGRLEEKKSLDLIALTRVTNDAGEEASYWVVEAAATGLTTDDRVVVPPFGVLRHGEKVREEVTR